MSHNSHDNRYATNYKHYSAMGDLLELKDDKEKLIQKIEELKLNADFILSELVLTVIDSLQVGLLRSLLEIGIDPNITVRHHGVEPVLHFASRQCSVQSVEVLLQAKADPNINNDHNE